MTTDWSEFESEVRGSMASTGPRCQVRTLLDNLPDEARLAVLDALFTRDLPSTAIRKALAKRVGDDATPSLWSIGNHRRRNCACR